MNLNQYINYDSLMFSFKLANFSFIDLFDFNNASSLIAVNIQCNYWIGVNYFNFLIK